MDSSNASNQSNIMFSPAVSARLRAQSIDEAEFTCYMCGIGSGEIDTATGKRARLHVGYILDKRLGGKDKLSNLAAACSVCVEGRKSIDTEKPPSIWLLSQVRWAGLEEQRIVLDWLREQSVKRFLGPKSSPGR